MKRFVGGVSRDQSTMFPESLDDFVDADNAVRVVDAFVEELDLGGLGFARVAAKATGRPSYHPSVLLKLYIYGYLNRVQSSRRLEREAARNVEVMWLTGRLVPDHKTIADFRRDNGAAKDRCTTGVQRRITRWEHEHLLEDVQRRLDENPHAMRRRRETVEHPFGTIKARMGATHFLMRRLKNVRTEMALSVLAYNLTRVMNIIGIRPLIAAIGA
ncbi:MAG: transposase [Proteobacteria bacterium]|nr:transposase [Pseudomonadota bacterium]